MLKQALTDEDDDDDDDEDENARFETKRNASRFRGWAISSSGKLTG